MPKYAKIRTAGAKVGPVITHFYGQNEPGPRILRMLPLENIFKAQTWTIDGTNVQIYADTCP